MVGAALAGLFALVFVLVQGRPGRSESRESAALLAFATFVVPAVVPTIKDPANPHLAGDPGSTRLCTALQFELIEISFAAGALGAALAWLSAAAALRLMPTVGEVLEHF